MPDRVSHYEIVRRLGEGGMGEVHEAIDLDLGRHVALKFIAGHYGDDPEALKRFEREARVAAALHHPHIATLFAFDRSTPRAFIVMELLPGRTLRQVLGRGPLAVPEALRLARAVADALAYAHRREVAHRDIKPENLMFDSEGAIKITDFGLARMADASRLTHTGSTLGTPSYMAPELLPGSAASEAEPAPGASFAADVFALGVTLYEMLAGALPFTGPNALSVLYAIANTEPEPLRTRCPAAPPAVEALVMRMLDKSPATRPTAADVAKELAALTGWSDGVSGSSASASGAGVPASIVSADAPTEAVTSGVTSAVTSAVTLSAERLPARVEGAELPVPYEARTRGRGAIWLAALLGLVVLSAGISLGEYVRRGQAAGRAVALNNEGHDSLAAGNLTAARARFESALALSPRYPEAKLNLASVLASSGRADSAAALYGDVLREHASRKDLLAAAHYGLGELDMQARAWPSAISHLTEATQQDSSRAEYPNNLAFALIQAGRTGEALATLRVAQARFPAEAALFKNAALAWFASGNYDSALVAADRSVRMRPDFAAGWMVKLRSEAARGDRTAALASFRMLRQFASKAMLEEAQAALDSGKSAAQR